MDNGKTKSHIVETEKNKRRRKKKSNRGKERKMNVWRKTDNGQKRKGNRSSVGWAVDCLGRDLQGGGELHPRRHLEMFGEIFQLSQFRVWVGV